MGHVLINLLLARVILGDEYPFPMPDTALVIIDVQREILEGSPPAHDPATLLANIGTLLAEARRQNVMVVFVQDDTVGGGPGNEDWEIPAAIAPREDEIRIRKRNCDSFHETPLGGLLRERGIAHLIVAGCSTPYCIDTSCRRAVTLGYRVTLAGDAHSTCDSNVLPATSIIAHHNQVLNGFGADIGEQEFLIAVKPTAEVRF